MDQANQTETATKIFGYCANCGKPFEANPRIAPHKRFCSSKCRDQWHYLNVTKPKRGAKPLADTNLKTKEPNDG